MQLVRIGRLKSSPRDFFAGIFRLTSRSRYGSLSLLTEVDDLSQASAHNLRPGRERGWLRRAREKANRKIT